MVRLTAGIEEGGANCLAVSGEPELIRSVEEMINAMERHGWAEMPGYIGDPQSLRLRKECTESCGRGDFQRAGVGRGRGLEVREGVRSDEVMWMDERAGSTEQAAYLVCLEEIRLALNRRLFLGLFDFEGHFAIYPEGGFYKPHLDRHAGTDHRILTAILYLNEGWEPGDGGELKLWTTPGSREGDFQLIEPRMGTLVCFMSGDFWHEVLPARKTRMSITGWFRQN